MNDCPAGRGILMTSPLYLENIVFLLSNVKKVTTYLGTQVEEHKPVMYNVWR